MLCYYLQEDIIGIGSSLNVEYRVVNSESSRRNRNDIMMTHGFRKFYETMLVDSNIHETIIRKLTGHSENGNLTQRYSKQIEEKMLEEYMKPIDLFDN